ncbi:MAG: glutaminase [Geminicoccaceae bacterium]
MDLQAVLEEIHVEAQPYFGKGKVADYIPALGRINPNKLGIALQTVDGLNRVIGDGHELFSIQSIVKVFSLMLALSAVGDQVWTRVGKEPSGDPFNSLILLEHEKGVPRNPFINAGALVVVDILLSIRPNPDLWVRDYVRVLAQNHSIDFDPEVAQSERAHADVNAALAHLMKSHGALLNPVDRVLDAYCRICALAMSCNDLARAFLPLAAGGASPLLGECVLTARQARRVNALMLTCGMYDSVGSFAYRVGFPAKSGVGGGIAAVVPERLTICVWSPELDLSGNSYVGTAALELFTRYTKLSIF